MTQQEFCKKYNLTEDQFFGKTQIDGNLDLSSLTSIPEGFNPTVGESLNLRSLKSIPEGFNPTVGGSLYLRSLKSIPKGFNENDYIKPLPLIEWPSGYLKCDDRFSKIKRKIGNVYVLTDINSEKEYYLVTDGEGNYAHGDAIESAKADLIYKTSKRDVETYRGLNLDEAIDFQECIVMYRSITGSCSLGVKNFLESMNLEQKPYTVREIIKLTEGSYGHEVFKRFFG